jgi:hypothetical protein
MCLLGCKIFLKGNEGQKKVEEGCNLSCRFRAFFESVRPILTIVHIHDPTCPRCAFCDARPSWRATKVKRRLVVTCHVVSGAYLEKRSMDFNHITHTWSPHDLDVPFGVHDPLKVKRRSKKVVTCHVISGAYLENRQTDFNHITHRIPTCPRCAFWGEQPSEGQKKVVTFIPLQNHLWIYIVSHIFHQRHILPILNSYCWLNIYLVAGATQPLWSCLIHSPLLSGFGMFHITHGIFP